MKRYSRSHHTTLSEINITPLLDLAFVLLVIFVITTTPLVHDVNLALPEASTRPKDQPRKPNYVSVDGSGRLFLNMRPVDLDSLLADLVDLRTQDQDLSVIVRGDGAIPFQKVQEVLETLQRANVFKVNLATEPLGPGR